MMRIILSLVIISTMVISLSAQTGPYLDTVEIQIEQDSIQFLENDPWADIDVQGDFIDNSGYVYKNIDLHYRGAWAQFLLILFRAEQRNWKVKVHADDMYRKRREWNFNYSGEVYEEMAYLQFKKMGVPCVNARHVNFYLNGTRQGLYLEYEDPDNKPWLMEEFGDDSGDLYKAALDQPNTPSYFAELTYLGPNNSDYFKHYRKKTNHKVAPEDYSSIRNLILHINFAPNDVFIDSLEKYFNTDKFIDYLVVSNFIGFSDGYPYRPKNYWLYQNPANGNRFCFIPWDMDATMQMQTTEWYRVTYNTPIYYQYLQSDWQSNNEYEGEERPLVRRMMKYAEYRNAFLDRYNEALNTIFREDLLYRELDSLARKIEQNSSLDEFSQFNVSVNSCKQYLSNRIAYISSVLDTISYLDTIPVTGHVDPYPVNVGFGLLRSKPENPTIYTYPNPVRNTLTIETVHPVKGSIELLNLNGQLILCKEIEGTTYQIDLSSFQKGIYFITIKSKEFVATKKIIKLD